MRKIHKEMGVANRIQKEQKTRHMDDSGRILILRPWKKNPICADIHWKEYQNTNSLFVARILFHNISQITFCFNIIKKLCPLANNDIKLKSWLLSSSRQFCFKFLINLLWKEKRGLFVGLIS